MKKLFLLTLFLSINILYGQRQYSLTNAFPNLQGFNEPVYLTNAGDGSNRLFVVEQPGVIWEFDNTPSVNSKTKFLDIQSKVASGGEMGLLSVAFHPHYESNGYIYVNYTAANPLRTVISRFTVNPPGSNEVDTTSEYKILEILQPYENHNGGLNMFGPDGYLYIGMGDGGSAGDPEGNAQNRSVLLGKMLRINVDSTQDTLHYAIPPDNPYVGNIAGFREEIWSYGLRNPWRFSFDPATNWLYCGDVGQDKTEEIDIIQRGKNYGWNIMEASKCYAGSHCDTTGLTKPIKEHSHPKSECITGGYVYRGASVPSAAGQYFYADFVTNLFWTLTYDGSRATKASQLFKSSLNIPSFGVDEQNELYIISYGGSIYRFVAETCQTGGTQRYRTLRADSTLNISSIKISVQDGMLRQAPNAASAVEALFKKLKNKETPFLGIKQINKVDAKQYAWVSYMKTADLAKLYTYRHDTLYYPLDSIRGATITKMKGAIKGTRAKINNAAIEQGVVFRMNILLSDSGITPPGFGNLLLDTAITLAGRQLKGMSLKSVANYYDSVMTYWKAFGMNTPSAYAELKTFVESVLRPLNNAFASEILYTGNDYAVNSFLVKKNPFAISLGGLKTAGEIGLVKEGVESIPGMNTSQFSSKSISFDFSIYPNPFNPTTTFSFDLRNTGLVTLKIYNTLGQEVATLVNETKEQGKYSVVWNATDSPTGIYFVQLSVGSESRVEKVLLMK